MGAEGPWLVAVVAGPPLGVAEDFVGLGDGQEPSRGVGVVGVGVGMGGLGQAAVGPADLGPGGPGWHVQEAVQPLVIVASGNSQI